MLVSTLSLTLNAPCLRTPLLITVAVIGPPAAKKRKTKPAAGADNDAAAENGENGDNDEEEPAEDEVAEDEDAAETAEASGPAEAAAKAKGGNVPKESDLSEVDAAAEA